MRLACVAGSKHKSNPLMTMHWTDSRTLENKSFTRLHHTIQKQFGRCGCLRSHHSWHRRLLGAVVCFCPKVDRGERDASLEHVLFVPCGRLQNEGYCGRLVHSQSFPRQYLWKQRFQAASGGRKRTQIMNHMHWQKELQRVRKTRIPSQK